MSEDLKRSRDEEGGPGVAKKQRTGSVNPNTAGDKGGSGNGANANSASAGSVKKKIQPQSIDELEKLTLKELGKFSKEYFKAILKRWESDLLARPPEVKNSGLGRAATGQFKQANRCDGCRYSLSWRQRAHWCEQNCPYNGRRGD